jgi:hypothetical protein
VSAVALGGHAVHALIFGVEVAVLVIVVGPRTIRRRRRRVGPPRVRELERGIDRPSDGLWFAAAGLVVAAAIHATVITAHFRESVLFGLFFVVLTPAQCWLAVFVTRRPDRRTVRYVAAGSLCVVALWLVSRTTGLPIGPEPWRPESFGGFDIAATGAELATAIGCLLHLRTVPNWRRLFVEPSAERTPSART